MFWANSDQLNFLTPLAPLGMYNHFHLSLFHSFSLFHFLPLTLFFLPLSLFASRILTNENISPLLAVILEPQIHLITMHYPLGTLFHILHDMEAGTHPQTQTHTHTCILETETGQEEWEWEIVFQRLSMQQTNVSHLCNFPLLLHVLLFLLL